MNLAARIAAAAVLLNAAAVVYGEEVADAAPVSAVEQKERQEPKFTIAPTGHLSLDAALYASPDKDLFPDGVSIPEARLGVRMTYGKWTGRVEVGYAYEKVGLKDVFLQYNFNDKNYVKIGSFIHMMGLNSIYGASTKPTMIEPTSYTVFNDVRQLGVMYVHAADKYLLAGSVHGEPNNTKLMLRPDQMTESGFGVRTRLVARPVHSDGNIIQAGISGAFSTPQYSGSPDTHNSFTFGAKWPTKVAQTEAMNCKVTDSRNLFKINPELLLCYQRIALESEYYFMQVNRKHGATRFQGQGAYVTVRGLIIGDQYPYNMSTAVIPTAKPKSLEALIGYNYTTISDRKAGIFGGRMNEASFTLNYYINKYMIARFHYSYAYVWDTSLRPATSFNGFMIRLQAIF